MIQRYAYVASFIGYIVPIKSNSDAKEELIDNLSNLYLNYT